MLADREQRIADEADDEDLIDRLLNRAGEIDPEACAAFDRQGNATPIRLQDRRAHALRLAADEYICGGDPAIAAALRGLEEATWH